MYTFFFEWNVFSFVERTIESIEEHDNYMCNFTEVQVFTSNHRFIAKELFRMVQGPHSSDKFND